MYNNYNPDNEKLPSHPFSSLNDEELSEVVGESMTQPDLSMTPREILDRFTRGNVPPIAHYDQYDTDYFNGNPSDDQLLDLQQDADKFETLDRLRLQALNKRANFIERAKQAAKIRGMASDEAKKQSEAVASNADSEA